MAPITVGVFMTALDVGAVNVSLPSISTHFQTDLSTIQWVVSVYLLVLAATLLPMGRAADLLGRKRIYVAAYFVFVVGSLLAGSALDFGWLLGARPCRRRARRQSRRRASRSPYRPFPRASGARCSASW